MQDPRAVRTRIAEALGSIGAGRFEPTPGPACTYCDFRSFCEPGKAWVAEHDASPAASASADRATPPTPFVNQD
jgi:hypothetical protein